MAEFGLLGKNISYSFSRGYFNTKFEKEGLDHHYVNFDIETVESFKTILDNNLDVQGFNVTIPYKQSIIPFLDDLDKKAKDIGAVNVIKRFPSGFLKGYNTDYYGFKKSLEPHLKPIHTNALILGTGGASKAVAFALKELKIDYDYVSRTNRPGVKFLYSDLTDQIISSYSIIINCTPIGTYPNVNDCPDIPFEGIGENHILYDLIYNPPATKFLIVGELKGATTLNGQQMLELQAEKAWKIWTKG
ncbi:shikimate dehydrogenase family protein [Aegicerativicinus sediminis]|uniref:shikimate dehydrogenase family protein n=1 Tax=Aegicerativicinus sediminis TaxID=2893202 RepID=UPI001E2FF7A5|nr:shikimate dehydrogenase [Aegicerativicinus sediminis]